MPREKLDDVNVLLRAHLDEEAQAGFPNLSQTPSTGTIKLLDYFAILTSADRDLLLNTLARIDAMRFFSPLAAMRDQMRELSTTDPALLRYRAAMQSPLFVMGLRYQGARMAKSVVADRMSREMMERTRATLDFKPRDSPPAALAPDPDLTHLKPAKAPTIRKLIDKAFKELFASRKRKLEGGETEYTGLLLGTNITVWVDFAAMGLQLRYGVSIPDETRTVFVSRLAYEDLWAAGPGWDYLTEENAETSIHLLCEHIARVVRLRDSVIRLM